MSDDDRRAFSNLILLCKPHHELVDTRHPDRYSADELEKWKRLREGDSIASLAEVGSVTDELLADLLTQSVADVQEHITEVLRAQEAALRRRIESLRGDASFARFWDALDAADELSLLSKWGIRASAPLNDFFLRIQRVDQQLLVHLDTIERASVFKDVWQPGESFSEVMLRLASQVRPTFYWPGAERWEFASAIDRLVDVLLCGLDLKARGGWIANAVQLVGSSWLLSDWEALGLLHEYQILYRRLDEMDWYSHLCNKSWTATAEVAEMLDQAEFLRTLAAGAPPE
jgi:hypothetical protein